MRPLATSASSDSSATDTATALGDSRHDTAPLIVEEEHLVLNALLQGDWHIFGGDTMLFLVLDALWLTLAWFRKDERGEWKIVCDLQAIIHGLLNQEVSRAADHLSIGMY